MTMKDLFSPHPYNLPGAVFFGLKPEDLYLKLLEIGKHIGSNAVDVPVKFQSDTIIQTTNLVASRFHETLQ